MMKLMKLMKMKMSTVYIDMKRGFLKFEKFEKFEKFGMFRVNSWKFEILIIIEIF